MLYFSKIRIILIATFTTIFVYIFLSNFIKFDDNVFNKKINLGLDLQGGSYLLLEIDNSPVITQKLQNAIPELKKFFKEKKINLRNFKIVDDETLIFETTPDKVNEVKDSLLKKEENIINEYYPKYRAHKFDFLVDQNLFKLNFSKYGLVEIKDSSQSQALETIRRRVAKPNKKSLTLLKKSKLHLLPLSWEIKQILVVLKLRKIMLRKKQSCFLLF